MKNCPHAEKYTPRGGRAIMQNMNEETIQAARDAWRRNPEDAAMALLGITPEEMFVQAIRGCNQHGHKQGCPDANGGGEKKPSAWAERWRAKNDEEKLKSYEASIKKYEEKVKKTGNYDDFSMLKSLRQTASKFRKKIAGSVLDEADNMFKEIRRIHEEKGTEFLRQAGVNIGDASAAHSRARGAAKFAKENPASERWQEALADMKKGSAELRDVYGKLKGKK